MGNGGILRSYDRRLARLTLRRDRSALVCFFLPRHLLKCHVRCQLFRDFACQASRCALLAGKDVSFLHPPVLPRIQEAKEDLDSDGQNGPVLVLV